MSFIELDKVNFSYKDNNNVALKNINLKIEKGELVLIIGPTGAGKSTLLSILDEPSFKIDSINYEKLINLVIERKKKSNLITIISDYKYDNIFYLADKVVFIERAYKPIKLIDEIPIIEVNKLGYTYNNYMIKLCEINFKAYYGEIISIVDANNSGKKAFFNLINGLCCPFSRSIKIEGKKCNKISNNLWKYIGYIPEDLDKSFSFENILDEFNFLKKKLKKEFNHDLYEGLKFCLSIFS